MRPPRQEFVSLISKEPRQTLRELQPSSANLHWLSRGYGELVVTREEAKELLESFRHEAVAPPPMDPWGLSQAYVRIIRKRQCEWTIGPPSHSHIKVLPYPANASRTPASEASRHRS